MSSFDGREFELWFKDLIGFYRKNYHGFLPEDEEEDFIKNSKEVLNLYINKKDDIEKFGIKVLKIFQAEKNLGNKIHSYGFRLKDEAHLAEKLIRKRIENPGINITCENFFPEITDLAGLRILQLYKTDIKEIHYFISNCKGWKLSKEPVAYNFSPRFLKLFRQLDMEVKEKSTGYSSAHYIVQHPEYEDCRCEIQVRTLFEEGWSEIDHTFNYPRGKPGKICQNLLETLKRICDVSVYIADQIPEIYEAEKKYPDRVDDLDYAMAILQNNIITNLQEELEELKKKITPFGESSSGEDFTTPIW